MGTSSRSIARSRQQVEGQTAKLTVEDAERRRLSSERNLAYQEQYLGTEEQVAGTLGGESADVIGYMGRYTMDETGAASLAFFGRDVDRLQANLVNMNDLMQQAEDAARAGDSNTASRLRAQADQLQHGSTQDGGGWYGFNRDSANVAALYSFHEDPEAKGKSRLGGTMARTVGGLVKQGREFLDPESETSRRYKASLTEGADRAIASASREAQRQQRDMSLSFGAGRSLGRERDFAQRTQDSAAMQRAQVHTQAAAQFEQFSRAFAADSVQLGQAWLQNQGEIRETFQGAMDALAGLAGKFAQESAGLYSSQVNVGTQAAAQKYAARQERNASYVKSATGFLGGVMSPATAPTG